MWKAHCGGYQPTTTDGTAQKPAIRSIKAPELEYIDSLKRVVAKRQEGADLIVKLLHYMEELGETGMEIDEKFSWVLSTELEETIAETAKAHAKALKKANKVLVGLDKTMKMLLDNEATIKNMDKGLFELHKTMRIKTCYFCDPDCDGLTTELW